MMFDQWLTNFVPVVVRAIEMTGVAVIAVGALVTMTLFLLAVLRRIAFEEAIACFRTNLGRAILIGLEFLVAADIINTVVVEMNLENVASLAIIVIIRTLLSFTLEAEIEGRWPWQRDRGKARHEG